MAAGALFAPTVNPDLLVLALPFQRGETLLTAVVFVGGFSAATAMVIVEAVALSAMVSNSLILPFLARDRWRVRGDASDMAGVILQVRRGAIVAVLLLAWLYYQATDQSRGLAAMGLVSFAAMAQLAPALFGAVLWRGGHAQGALAGMTVGIGVWIVMLALPQLSPSAPWHLHVMLGIGDPLALGVFVSLALNLAAYVGVSRFAQPRLIDRVQARAFVDRLGPDWMEARPAPSGASVGDLRALVARFIGDERAERAFTAWGDETAAKLRDADPADAALARAAERMLAGAIGAASARRVIAAALAGVGRAPEDVVRMLDEASQAVQFNRDLLQTTLDNIDQGVIVVDEDLRVTAWNRRYVAMFDLPVGFVHVGLPIAVIYRLNAERGESPDDIEAWVERRLEALSRRIPHDHERQQPDDRVLLIGAAGEPAIAHLIEVPMHWLGVPEALMHPIALVIALVIVTFLHMVVGEMVPKNIAIAVPSRVAQVLGPVLHGFVVVFRPFIWIMNATANHLVRWLFKVEPKDEVASAFTSDDVRGFVAESGREGLLDTDEIRLLTGALNFENKTSADVALPLTGMRTVPFDITVAGVEELCAETGYSRFPVVGSDGSLEGYIHTKDVLGLPETAREPATPDRAGAAAAARHPGHCRRRTRPPATAAGRRRRSRAGRPACGPDSRGP